MLTDAIKALDEAESLINMVETNTTVDPRHMSYRALQHLKQVRGYLEKLGAQSELIGYYSKTGHGTYYHETLTPEIAELTHGGVPMWKPMFAAPVQQEKS